MAARTVCWAWRTMEAWARRSTAWRSATAGSCSWAATAAWRSVEPATGTGDLGRELRGPQKHRLGRVGSETSKAGVGRFVATSWKETAGAGAAAAVGLGKGEGDGLDLHGSYLPTLSARSGPP